MATFRIKHDGQYTKLNNNLLQDNSLSFRARGLLASLLSYPNDWVVSLAHLSKQSPKEGRDAIKIALKELMCAGYVVKGQKRNDNGRFDCNEYLIFETPQGVEPLTEKPLTEKPLTEKPLTEKPLTEKPLTANPHLQINKEQINKDQQRNKDTNPPTPPRGDESEVPIEVELISEPEAHPITQCCFAIDCPTEKESTALVVPKKEFGEDKLSLGERTEPFGNRKSGLMYQKEKALAQSLRGSPFDSVEEQDEFFSQHLSYLRATSPNLTPGQITAIAKAALKRIMAGLPDPEDRRVLTLWASGQLGQFRGLVYDPSEQRRTDTQKRLQQTAAKYLAEKEREKNAH